MPDVRHTALCGLQAAALAAQARLEARVPVEGLLVQHPSLLLLFSKLSLHRQILLHAHQTLCKQ